MQEALAAALAAWKTQGLPRDPGAWLYRAAYNRLMSDLRQRGNRLRLLEGTVVDFAETEIPHDAARFSDEVADDMLRMLFIACDEAIPPESRLVFALKTLGGFSTAEIALRLFTTEGNVHKRLARARDRLRETSPELEAPPLEILAVRLPSVHEVLYLLFNEGYLSAHEEQAIRRELCDEAIRFTTLLAENPVGKRPETFALLALMHLHTARLAARQDRAGGLLLLEEQDRTLWDRNQMGIGMGYLAKASTGGSFSRYHAEAGIAAEHCLAPSFHQTRWKEIDELYSLLERLAPSPLHTLNRAIAAAESRGPESGLSILKDLAPPSWLSGSYLWDAVFSDLHRRTGNREAAGRYAEQALESAPTEAVKELLRRRLRPN